MSKKTKAATKEKKWRYQLKDKDDFTCQLVARINANIYLGARDVSEAVFSALRNECKCNEPQTPCWEIEKCHPYLSLYMQDVLKFENPLNNVGYVMDKLENGYAVLLCLSGSFNHQVLAFNTVGRYRISVIDTWRKEVDVRNVVVNKIYCFKRHSYYI